MKRIALFLFPALMICLSLVSCKKDEGPSDQDLLRQTWEVKSMISTDEDFIGSGKETITEIDANGNMVPVEIEWYTKAQFKFEADGDVEMLFMEGDNFSGEEKSFFLGKYTLGPDRKLVLDFLPSDSEEYEGMKFNFDCSIDVLTETQLEFDGQMTITGGDEDGSFPVQIVAQKIQ